MEKSEKFYRIKCQMGKRDGLVSVVGKSWHITPQIEPASQDAGFWVIIIIIIHHQHLLSGSQLLSDFSLRGFAPQPEQQSTVHCCSAPLSRMHCVATVHQQLIGEYWCRWNFPQLTHLILVERHPPCIVH